MCRIYNFRCEFMGIIDPRITNIKIIKFMPSLSPFARRGFLSAQKNLTALTWISQTILVPVRHCETLFCLERLPVLAQISKTPPINRDRNRRPSPLLIGREPCQDPRRGRKQISRWSLLSFRRLGKARTVLSSGSNENSRANNLTVLIITKERRCVDTNLNRKRH